MTKFDFNQRAREVLDEYWECDGSVSSFYAFIASALERVAAEARNEALKQSQLIAFDATSDEPQPWNWNSACVEVQNRIRQLIKSTPLTASQSGGKEPKL